MRAVVTGASGFVGHHLVDLLVKSGDAVTATGHHDRGNFDPSVTYQQIDLTDSLATASLNWQDVDVVYHLAGLAAVGASFDKPELYRTMNPGMQQHIFEACQKAGARPRFIIISSGNLYDPTAPLPLTEMSPVKANSPYAESKILQEQQALEQAHQGHDVIIARPFNHIGPGQQTGFLVSDLASQIANAERSRQTTISVGNLSSKRDYTDVRDIVRAYQMLATKGQPGEIYNISSGRSVAGQDILDQLLALSSTTITTQPNEALMRPSDIPDLYGDASKLHAATGWKPEIPLTQTLQDVLDYWRAQ
jgi:GDP-4-dehydro-6-deoxy-D-mannose reductase